MPKLSTAMLFMLESIIFCCFGREKPDSCKKQRRVSFSESDVSTCLNGSCAPGHDDSANEASIEDRQPGSDATWRREWLIADAKVMAAEAKVVEDHRRKRIASCAAAAAVEQIVAVASKAVAQDKQRDALVAAPRMAKLTAFKKSVEQRAAAGPLSAGDLHSRFAALRRGCASK